MDIVALRSQLAEKCRVVQVHTLVATYFIGDPPKSMPSPTVNHIDHNKLNNNVSNLEWMSVSNNSRDGQYNLCIRFIDEENKPEFLSCALASKHIGRQSQYIRSCINSHRPVRDLGNSIKEIEIKRKKFYRMATICIQRSLSIYSLYNY
jgi:hypothetical protein